LDDILCGGNIFRLKKVVAYFSHEKTACYFVKIREICKKVENFWTFSTSLFVTNTAVASLACLTQKQRSKKGRHFLEKRLVKNSAVQLCQIAYFMQQWQPLASCDVRPLL